MRDSSQCEGHASYPTDSPTATELEQCNNPAYHPTLVA